MSLFYSTDKKVLLITCISIEKSKILLKEETLQNLFELLIILAWGSLNR